MAGTSLLALLFPRTALREIWRINPTAHAAFLAMGVWSFVLLAALSTACALSTYALWRGAEWGRRLAMAILVANMIGDTGNAVFRSDLRTLIGLPIAGLMVVYLLSARARAHFGVRPGGGGGAPSPAGASER